MWTSCDWTWLNGVCNFRHIQQPYKMKRRSLSTSHHSFRYHMYQSSSKQGLADYRPPYQIWTSTLGIHFRPWTLKIFWNWYHVFILLFIWSILCVYEMCYKCLCKNCCKFCILLNVYNYYYSSLQKWDYVYYLTHWQVYCHLHIIAKYISFNLVSTLWTLQCAKHWKSQES